MKRTFAAIAILAILVGVGCGAVRAQSSLTPNVMFQLPAYQQQNWQVPIDFNFNVLDSILGGSAILPTGATPSITTTSNWITAGAGATTITNFVGGYDGQTIRIVCGSGDTFTTLANATNIEVSSTWSCSTSPYIQMTLLGSVWTETSRFGTGGGGGSGCTISGGAAGDLLYNNGSGGCSSTADYIITSHTLAGSSSAVLDMSAAATEKVPKLGLQFPGSTSGLATVVAQAVAGTTTFTLPTVSGTFAITASSPIVLNTTTGNLTCPTCTTGGITGTVANNQVAVGTGSTTIGSNAFLTWTTTLGLQATTIGTSFHANGGTFVGEGQSTSSEADAIGVEGVGVWRSTAGTLTRLIGVEGIVQTDNAITEGTVSFAADFYALTPNFAIASPQQSVAYGYYADDICSTASGMSLPAAACYAFYVASQSTGGKAFVVASGGGESDFQNIKIGSSTAVAGIQGTDTKLLSAGTVSGTTGATFCTDANGGATTTGCSGGGSGVTIQTNGSGNAVQSTLNFINSTANATGLTITAINPATTGNERFEIGGTIAHASIANTAVTPGSYTSANITVAADGSIIAASNGSGGGGGVSNCSTAGRIAYYAVTGTTVSCDANLDDGATQSNALTYKGVAGIQASAGPVLAVSDGVHAGLAAIGGNTTVPTGLPTNSWGFIAPNSASFTSYFLQFTTAAPATSIPSCAAPSSNVSACTWVTFASPPAIGNTAPNTGAFTTMSLGSGATVFNSAGLATSYDGMTTAGTGLDVVLAVFDVTNVSTANSGVAQTVLLAPATGLYKFDGYVDQSGACSNVGPGLLTLAYGSTDATAARITGPFTIITPSTSADQSASPGTYEMWAISGTAMTLNFTYTACTTGTWTYDAHFIISRVH